MNHAYRLIWNAAVDSYVPAPEFARSRGRKSGGKALAAALLSGLALNALGLPTDGQVSVGQGSIATAGGTMTVTQASQKMAINWDGFSIAPGETVRFLQPGSGAIALNRVLGNDPSAIYGRLQANGQVFLLNPNGVLFGRTAQVNVGGLVASTLGLSDRDFVAGRFTFRGQGGSVANQGSIAARDGGYVALLGARVSNEGTIAARLGTVALGAGSQATLDFAGDRLVNLQVDRGAIDALARNRQLIQADGGLVVLTAKGADALLRAVVNNEGVIEARTVENRNGTIVLLGDMAGGAVQVSGLLDASAPDGGNGGFIETSAARVHIGSDARVTTAAPGGKAGTWLIDPNDYTIAASGGDITGTALSTSLASNNVTIVSSQGATPGNGDLFVNDAVAWSANTTLTLSAYRDINVNANITATGRTAGLALNPNMGGGGGGYRLNKGAIITLSGATPSLAIAGQSYTVVNDVNALQAMGAGLGGRYALGSDIDAAATGEWNGGAGFVPVGNVTASFAGILDGFNHTITGLAINRPAADYVGLFGNVSGTVMNLGLAAGSVRAHQFVGGLAGYNTGAIGNSHNTGTVEGAARYIGGLVGGNSGTILYSYSAGPLSGASDYVGGLVGKNVNGSIRYSYSAGPVNGSALNSYYVGGLVGENTIGGTIADSYSTGAVRGASYVGGLVGSNVATIRNSYSSGAVNGTTSADVGGFTGRNRAYIYDSYWDTQTTGKPSVQGHLATGLSTAELMAQSTYSGWDFTNTWWMSEGNTRPILRSEYSINIGNAHQLQLMALDPAGRYALTRDIAMAEVSVASGVWNRSAGFVPVGTGSTRFAGTLDGMGHVIRNLAINRPESDYVGLLGILSTTGTVKDIGLEGGSVTGRGFVGGLAGINWGSISGSHSSGTVNGSALGVGGLVGSNFPFATITNSYSEGEVKNTDSYVGGLVGYNSGAIANSYSRAAVLGKAMVGGLAGHNYGGSHGGTIANSYSTGTVSGTSTYVGGLVGDNEYGTISSSYSSGRVNGYYSPGGLSAGNSGTITDSYWDTQTSGRSTSKGGTGLTTAQMMQSASLTGFDFTNTWWMSDGNTRPLLRSEYSTRITNAHQLQLMALDLAGRYVLARDIDLAEVSVAPGVWSASTGFVPVGTASTPFSGTLDGSGHVISHLTIQRAGADQVGLFGRLTGRVEDLGLTNVNVSGHDNVGALAGSSSGTIVGSYGTGAVKGASSVGGLAGFNSGTIESSYNSGAVTGSWYNVGGLAGLNEGGTIANSYNLGQIRGFSYVGGLAGLFKYGSIRNSYNSGAVTGTEIQVGGLAGESYDSTIADSYNDGTINGGGYVGGLAGSSQWRNRISNSYNAGAVSGSWGWVGGLVGVNFYSPIENSYNAAPVNGPASYGDGWVGDKVGGLAGYSESGSIKSSYNLGPVASHGDYVGGLVGYNKNSTISESYNAGTVRGIATREDHKRYYVMVDGDWVGGVAGLNEGTIENSYNTGAVSGKQLVGGVVGENAWRVVTSYNSGRVSGTGGVGGVVGYNRAYIIGSFWDSQASGVTWSAGGTGMATADMKKETSFTSATPANGNVNPGWDFTTIWHIYEGQSYPLLANSVPPLTGVGGGLLGGGLLGGGYGGGAGGDPADIPGVAAPNPVLDYLGTAYRSAVGGPFASLPPRPEKMVAAAFDSRMGEVASEQRAGEDAAPGNPAAVARSWEGPGARDLIMSGILQVISSGMALPPGAEVQAPLSDAGER
ncbi:MAG: putative filamentous hemagglutinin family outer membrane protein [Rhodocyclaceae bacterium]|nr:putative filamentous hemagglutinin family outer membrane protein [Rhodocyclaceae bacterium]